MRANFIPFRIESLLQQIPENVVYKYRTMFRVFFFFFDIVIRAFITLLSSTNCA